MCTSPVAHKSVRNWAHFYLQLFQQENFLRYIYRRDFTVQCGYSTNNLSKKSQMGQQGRWANKVGGPTRQVSQKGRWANKAGRPTRQVGQQGREANKAGRPTRQVGQQGRQANKAGRQARSIDVPTLTANIFAMTTNRPNIHNKAGSMRH